MRIINNTITFLLFYIVILIMIIDTRRKYNFRCDIIFMVYSINFACHIKKSDTNVFRVIFVLVNIVV